MSAAKWNMKTFMKGASILTIAALIVKLLSAVYRVPFQNMVGDKGFYIYQQVYPFIGLFIVWTSAGFAVAVSKLLAESRSEGESKAIRRVALSYLIVLSLGVFVILTLAAPFFARAMGDEALAPLLQAGAYIVLALPFLAVLKGTFQSTGRMTPVAISNVTEQFVRVLVILLGTWMAVRAGMSLYKVGEITMWGAVAGEAAGVVILALYFRNTNQTGMARIDRWQTMKELTIASISVSASSLLLIMFQLVDSFTVYNALMQTELLSEAAMELKGVYDRGQPLVQMGSLVASTLALAMVPVVAHHASKGNGQGAVPLIRLTFRTAFLFGWAAAAGLMLVLPYVNEMLFETRAGSVALIICSMQIFWLSIILPLTAILQGNGKMRVPAILLMAGLLLKAVTTPYLVRAFGIEGAALSGNLGFLVIAGGLVIYFKRFWRFPLAPRRFYLVLAGATAAMTAAVIPWMLVADGLLFDALPSRWSATITALTAVGLGAAVFLFVVLKTRIMLEKEWYLLPFGRRLAIVQLKLNKTRR